MTRFRPQPRQRPLPGKMNKMEQRYSDKLKIEKMAGEIVDYGFEAINLRLAPKTYFRPDFVVIGHKEIEIHEVKGFWEDDARIKIKCAAEKYWYFKFIAVQWKKGEWIFEEF